MKTNLLAACALGLTWSCQSAPPPSPSSHEAIAEALLPKNVYARVTSSGELTVFFVRDADAGKWTDVVEGLDAFMHHCVQTDHEAWGHAVFQELKPVWRMQTAGGYKYVTAVQNMADVLRIGAERSVAKDRASWMRGDLNPLREAAADERSYMAPDVKKYLPDPLGADFLDAMFVAQELLAQTGVEEQRATVVATRCEQVASSLDKDGRAEDSLLLRIAGAQLLEAAKLDEQAMDRWLEISSAPALAHADAVLQVAVARRVRAFRDRLRDELSTSIRKEEAARADTRVAAAEQEASRLTEEQRARVASLEHDMDELTTRSKIEKEEAVKAEHELSAEVIAHHTQRITELEGRLVELATLRSESHTPIDWKGMNSEQSSPSKPADVLGQWQKSQASDAKAPAPEAAKPPAPEEKKP